MKRRREKSATHCVQLNPSGSPVMNSEVNFQHLRGSGWRYRILSRERRPRSNGDGGWGVQKLYLDPPCHTNEPRTPESGTANTGQSPQCPPLTFPEGEAWTEGLFQFQEGEARSMLAITELRGWRSPSPCLGPSSVLPQACVIRTRSEGSQDTQDATRPALEEGQACRGDGRMRIFAFNIPFIPFWDTSF